MPHLFDSGGGSIGQISSCRTPLRQPGQEEIAMAIVNRRQLNLIVTRSQDMDRAGEFYRSLGLVMTKHSHPPCGEHYFALQGKLVFEIYADRGKQGLSTGTTLGFTVASLDAVLATVESLGGIVIRPSYDSEWGRMATIRDPDGHTVLLTEGN